MKALLFLVMIAAGSLALSANAEECVMEDPDLGYSGDSWYSPQWNCGQEIIQFFWNAYDFDKGDWDGARGYDQPCDNTRPLARTFNGLYALHYSAADPAKDKDDWAGNILRWGATYARNHVDELDGSCVSDGAYARCVNCNVPILDEYIVLYQPFFYQLSVVERAATILHESRHDEKTHDANGHCPTGSNSCDSSWEYAGCNRYHAEWLMAFVKEGVRTNVVMKKRALDRARTILAERFASPPPLTVDDSWLSAITQKWSSLGDRGGFLGSPTSEEITAADGQGHYNHFEGGTVFWHPSTGAFEVHGAIREKYFELGWERSFLGYPTSDETAAKDTVGRFNTFQNGVITWHPSTGAHAISGSILDTWRGAGAEAGTYGYPTAEKSCSRFGCSQLFQRGTIRQRAATLPPGSIHESPVLPVLD